MSYKYEDERSKLFTEQNVELITTARANANRTIAVSGVVTMKYLIEGMNGEVWTRLAAVDYLVEKGELREVKQEREPAGQHRIFTK